MAEEEKPTNTEPAYKIPEVDPSLLASSQRSRTGVEAPRLPDVPSLKDIIRRQ